MIETSVQGFRLSYEQQSLWARNKHGYVQCAVRIKGVPDAQRLKQAVQRTVNTYEILRTTFRQIAGLSAPVQMMQEQLDFAWKTAAAEEDADTLIANEVETPFDLVHGPLLKAALFSQADDSSLFVLSLAAFCGDTVSLQHLLVDIQRAYDNELDEAEELIQYTQYSEWQHDLMEEAEAEEGRRFWNLQIENMNTVQAASFFEIKLDGKACYSQVAVEFSAETHARIASFSEDNAAWSNHLFAGWHSFMHRYTGQSEIAVERIFDGRKFEELEGSIGLFCKSLPVQHHYHMESCFDEVLEILSAKSEEIRSWMEYFPEEDYQSQKGNGTFLCGFMAYSSPPLAEQGSLQMSLHTLRDLCWTHPLTLVCGNTGQGLRVELLFDERYLSHEQANRMSRQFSVFFEQALDRTPVPVGQINMFDSCEQACFIEASVTKAVSSFASRCIHQLIEEQAARTPEAVALVCEGRQHTYRELNEQANQLSFGLIKLGVKIESTVGLFVERSIDMIVGMLAVLKAGGAYVPLDTAIPDERLAYMIEDAMLSAVLTQEHLIERIQETSVPAIVMDRQQADFERESKENPHVEVSIDNLLYIIYTSGSTGMPKGVAVEHQQLLHYVNGLSERIPFTQQAMSYATVSTLAADLGHTMIFPALMSGGCLHVISQERLLNPTMLADYFTTHRIDCLKIVPSHLTMLLTSLEAKHLLPRRFLVMGGEALTWSLVESIRSLQPDCAILNHYGPTETTVGVVAHDVGFESYPFTTTVPIGKPLAGTRAYVLNSHMQPVPMGVAGELYIGGNGVSRGYLSRPEAEQERYVTYSFLNQPEERVYRTGDLVRLLPGGLLEFVGRADYQVKIRGYRIELGEVEAALQSHPQVTHAVAVTNEENGETQLAAYVAIKGGDAVTVASLQQHVGRTLPEHAIPSMIAFLDTFPLTPNGKIDRKALPELSQLAAQQIREIIPPRTTTEIHIAAIWSQVLSASEISVHDKFFQIGGNSLRSVRVLAMLHENYSFVGLADLFEHNTIASLAAFIDRHGSHAVTANYDNDTEVIEL